MVERQDDFEEQLASYWEQEEDFDALHLSSRLHYAKKPWAVLRESAAHLFHRVHEGVSVGPNGNHRHAA